MTLKYQYDVAKMSIHSVELSLHYQYDIAISSLWYHFINVVMSLNYSDTIDGESFISVKYRYTIDAVLIRYLLNIDELLLTRL